MMTSRTPTCSRRGGGFTLVELLVVIGIIVVLFSIATPIVMTARRNAERVRTQGDLNTIAMALEAYKADFKDYPRPVIDPLKPATANVPVLAWALVGPWQAVSPDGGTTPWDGADGPGFRTQWNPANGGTGSKVWGPYLPPEKFPTEIENGAVYLLDRFGSRIEYFPRWRSAKPGASLFGVPTPGDPSSMANMNGGTGAGVYDCRQATMARVLGNPRRGPEDDTEPGPKAIYYLQRALGDGIARPGPQPTDPPVYPHNDLIDPPETPLTQYPPFVLLSRGHSRMFSSKEEVDAKFTKISEVSNLQAP
jgi:prepilin-type N-terminal cleavage/methylation domain-containing protein